MTKKKSNKTASKEGWIVKGYSDYLNNTPFKNSPTKDLDKKLRDQWNVVEHLYMDGLLSAQEDRAKGFV